MHPALLATSGGSVQEVGVRTQMDGKYTKDVNFASIINKFQVYDIAS